MTDFKDQYIRNLEQGMSPERAYEALRERPSIVDRADMARQREKDRGEEDRWAALTPKPPTR